jgi:hypothetical protein
MWLLISYSWITFVFGTVVKLAARNPGLPTDRQMPIHMNQAGKDVKERILRFMSGPRFLLTPIWIDRAVVTVHQCARATLDLLAFRGSREFVTPRAVILVGYLGVSRTAGPAHTSAIAIVEQDSTVLQSRAPDTNACVVDAGSRCTGCNLQADPRGRPREKAGLRRAGLREQNGRGCARAHCIPGEAVEQGCQLWQAQQKQWQFVSSSGF